MLYEDSVGKWLSALMSLGILVTSYQSKDVNLKRHCCENNKSHMVCFMCVVRYCFIP